jgi:hypothetical protein
MLIDTVIEKYGRFPKSYTLEQKRTVFRWFLEHDGRQMATEYDEWVGGLHPEWNSDDWYTRRLKMGKLLQLEEPFVKQAQDIIYRCVICFNRFKYENEDGLIEIEEIEEED